MGEFILFGLEAFWVLVKLGCVFYGAFKLFNINDRLKKEDEEISAKLISDISIYLLFVIAGFA